LSGDVVTRKELTQHDRGKVRGQQLHEGTSLYSRKCALLLSAIFCLSKTQ
jgi:hypothetical protein